MLLMTKVDLTNYVTGTDKPKADNDFVDQFDDGNDIAIYLVSRQAQRVRADPADVWERRYAVDFADPLLQDNWDDARTTALWNLLDRPWSPPWSPTSGSTCSGGSRGSTPRSSTSVASTVSP
jgi:hypothetical protein